MDRSYILNSYISDNEEKLKEKEQAASYLENLKFRINGSKSIEEIKKEVSIFLEKNNVPLEIKDELISICDSFDENIDIYHAQKYLEDYLSKYLEQKENDYQESNNTVNDIKEELVETVKKELDSVGITTTGNTENILDKIQSEDDVFKLKNNVATATDYFDQVQNVVGNNNQQPLEIPIEVVENVINNPGHETILETAKEEQENISTNENTNTVDVKEDGTIEITGDANNEESMNFTAMMTTALVATNIDPTINTNLDMKFIKNKEDKLNFKIIYGDFPLNNHPENKLNPIIINKIQLIAKNYNPNINYFDILKNHSIELSTVLMLINSHVLNENGSFKMAIKNGGKTYEMAFLMDENYNNVATAFMESGAMVSKDAMENDIVRVNNSTIGEQLMILTATIENLNQRKLEQSQIALQNQNQYQKKLVYPNQMNEVANVNNIFLIVVAITEVLLLTFGYLYLFH